jgi:hypothetical protein
MFLVKKMAESPSSSTTNKSGSLNHFRANYRFIDFKKSKCGDSSAASENSNKATAESFYLNLISDVSSNSLTEAAVVSERAHEPELTVKTSDSVSINFNAKDLFKAAQDNDLNYVKACAESERFDMSVVDDFRWNALMIAVAAHSNRVVEYLVNELKTVDTTLLANRDRSGNDALKLAERFKNAEAKRFIDSFYRNSLVKSEPVEETCAAVDDDAEQVLYCDICRREFSSCDESYTQHVASIVHQFNETERSGELAKTRFTSYNLRSSNKVLKIFWSLDI